MVVGILLDIAFQTSWWLVRKSIQGLAYLAGRNSPSETEQLQAKIAILEAESERQRLALAALQEPTTIDGNVLKSDLCQSI